MWKTIAVVGSATLALSGTAVAATDQQISVNGTGAAIVADGATNAQQRSAYDEALSAAINDAQAKAKSVAQQLSLTLGPVETFTEESDDYLGYCGVGFLPTAEGVSNAATPRAQSGTSGDLTPIPAKHKKHKKHSKPKGAHTAQAETEEEEEKCEIEADVTVVYRTS